MPQAFDLSKVSKYLEKNSNQIIGMTLNSLDGVEQKHVTLYQNIKDEKELHKLKAVANVVQPYRVAFEPKNNVFQPSHRNLKPRRAKVDIQIDPR